MGHSQHSAEWRFQDFLQTQMAVGTQLPQLAQALPAHTQAMVMIPSVSLLLSLSNSPDFGGSTCLLQDAGQGTHDSSTGHTQPKIGRVDQPNLLKIAHIPKTPKTQK